jgi:AcrR family transcriptional regulator
MGSPPPAETPAATAEKPLRRDAERNRQLILAAGRELFAERGPKVTLDDIAERAGVGVGTVYRRFPDRDSLIDELFTSRIDELVGAARAAIEVEDPWDGLVGFMRSHLEMQQADRSFAAIALSDIHGHEAVMHAKASLAPLVGQIVERAHEAGVIRPDLYVTDIPALTLMFGTILDATREIAPDVWERYFTFLLDGIRPTAVTPLPVAPLTLDQVPDAMRRGLQRK